MMKPFKTDAMIHSLHSKREVLIIAYEDNNHCQAVFGDKLCSAIYNPFTGMFYVDDIYGVIEECNNENHKQEDSYDSKPTRQYI